MTQQERMDSAMLYNPTDESIMAQQMACNEILYDFNQTRPSQQKERTELLKKLLAEVGENCYIEPPLRANWGSHTHFGHDIYANFNLVLVDDGDIFVGNHVMFGPNVTVITGSHPIEPDLRKQALQYNIPVHIADNTWIGAGSVLLPGVHIGENSVIGAGSVVTKDIPANVVAVGSPCKVLRSIGARDKEYYFGDFKIDYAEL